MQIATMNGKHIAWGKFEGEWKPLKWEVEVLTSAASTLFLFPWDKWSDNRFLWMNNKGRKRKTKPNPEHPWPNSWTKEDERNI